MKDLLLIVECFHCNNNNNNNNNNRRSLFYKPTSSNMFQSENERRTITTTTKKKTLDFYNAIFGSSTTIRSSTKSILFMAKGDGKKRRPKQQPRQLSSTNSNGGGNSNNNASSSSSSSFSSSSPPQRVMNDINIPVRRQIKYAKMKKEYEKSLSSPTSFRSSNVKKTSYRKKMDEDEIEEKKRIRSKRGQDPDWDVILDNNKSSPLLIVDAYNIIHRWSRLKKWLIKGQLSKARNLLIEDCENLKDIKGWRIEIVFDGAGRSTTGPLGDQPGTSLKRINSNNDNHNNGFEGTETTSTTTTTTSKGTTNISLSDQQSKASVTDHGVRVVYSGIGNSADSYIESRCTDAKKVTQGKITGSFIVASNDNMVRIAASNAGAYCMSSDHFVNELKAVRMVTKYRVEVAVAKANGQSIVRPIGSSNGSATKSTTISGGNQYPNMFRRNSNQFIIEDKRKKHNNNKKETKETSNNSNNTNENISSAGSKDKESTTTTTTSSSHNKATKNNIGHTRNNRNGTKDTVTTSKKKEEQESNNNKKNDKNNQSQDLTSSNTSSNTSANSVPAWAMIPKNSYYDTSTSTPKR